MSLNFGALSGNSSPDTAVRPQDIFSLLPEKSKRYQYLRDVQGAVLSDWYAKRAEKDLVLKMNTGSGKTIVGLLALKSCMNEGVGPAVYVAPTTYLVDQVKAEAESLGIGTTDDVTSPRFQRGKDILVINIYKLLNGKSVFGVGQEGSKIDIGSIVIDDAHACLSASEDQFQISIPSKAETYTKIFNLFESDLSAQSEAITSDIKEGDPNKQMLVPYWAWMNKQEAVRGILREIRNEDSVKFSLPLLSESLSLSRCVISGNGLEITPHCLPIDVIPSFANARRRIFMSAGLADDGILITDYNVPVEAVNTPICPPTAGDIGDRMILVPQYANPNISDREIKSFIADKAKTINTVVLVPSQIRSDFWSDVADRILTANNLSSGVEEMKAGHVGLVVLINRYDGIDLPDDACRLLVVDGMPDVRRRIEMIEQNALHDSSYSVSRSIQRIEQGMGRGIRSNEDYCAVLLMGRSLISTICSNGAMDRFTPATRAQMLLSEQLSEQLTDKGMEEIGAAIDQCLTRNKQWVAASRSATVGSTYKSEPIFNSLAVSRREAFNYATTRNYQMAVSSMQKAVNSATDSKEKGWLLQQLAEYRHPIDPVDAQVIQRSAVETNKFLLRPLDGITYTRMDTRQFENAAQCIARLRGEFSNGNEFLIDVNALLEDLIFAPDTSSRFERALSSVANLIGFRGQQPEAEAGVGPDVLWQLSGLEFFVIECKNGATSEKINKHDCNQLAGSYNWFVNQYGSTCSAVPILVHPYKTFERAATPHSETRIITSNKLDALRQSLRQFSISVAMLSNFGTPTEVIKLMQQANLTPTLFLENFTEKFVLSR